MKTIGIDTGHKSLVYEGDSFWGYPVYPNPTLIALSIVDESNEEFEPGDHQSIVTGMDFILTDEGFDPASRVRKGRLFKKYDGVQPYPWHVKPHPSNPIEYVNVSDSGYIDISLASYIECNLKLYLKQNEINSPLFLLGNKQEFTIWSLVDAETTVSGETLVYLKSRKVFGALPHLNKAEIPAEFFQQVEEKLDLLAEDIHRAGVESVIDRCREAATVILSSFLQSKELVVPGKDLSDLASVFEGKVKEKKYIVANLGIVLAKFHSRGKNAEQEKRSLRKPTEHDAELAIQSVGTIL